MIREAIASLVAGHSLSEAEATATMDEIMTGVATPAQMGAFLVALRLKGETVDEVTGMARGMRNASTRVPLPSHIRAIDTCGTGGDGADTFNISTAAGLLVASLGQPVAKHGNRAASSRCGSADVLESLGVKLDLGPEAVARCIERTNFGFMFAPTYHPAMRHVGPTRREVGVRTVFNILGPLTNPAGAQYQVLGVADARLVPLMAQALLRLGCSHALVIHGLDGVDEFSLSGPTLVAEVRGDRGDVVEYQVTPESVGLPESSREAVHGGDAAYNAALLRRILSGEQTGPAADMVALNAGAALYTTDRASSIAEGVRQAHEALREGKALATLDALTATTQRLSTALA